uniref:Sad1 and UNC84 domain containing 1 n=1 Tax=Catagonus wagneri TaxID=51154 RepID=A0A8C3X042_9CETA
MDFSRLHVYSPPQCAPENTGYTYALSSSYSSDALDFETEHKLDPVFDSPRMSRRSLRLVSTTRASADGPAGDRAARITKQRGGASRQAFTVNHTSRKGLSLALSQSPGAVQGEAYLRPPVLDESLIREQTTVDHFWGLDDDGDLKGGSRAALQGNGDVARGAAGAAQSNGYTCSDCSLLSSRGAALTTHSTSLGPTSRIYSRDRNQRRGASRLADRVWRLATRTLSSFSSLLVRLFRVALMKRNCESENYKLKSYESKDHESKSCESKSHESQARSSHRGRMDVREALRDDGHLPVNGASLWRTASEILWWLGVGWYQFVTLVSWLNVFLLTRCLRNICKFLILLIPLLLLLAVSLWSQGDVLAFLPVLSGPHTHRTQWPGAPSPATHIPVPPHPRRPLEAGDEAFHWHRMSEVERQVTSLSGQCHNHDEKLRELAALLQKLQARVDQMDSSGDGLLSLVKGAVGRHFQETGGPQLSSSQADSATFHREHELRISSLEDILGKLTGRSEAVQREAEQAVPAAASGTDEEQRLLGLVQHLEQELGRLKADLSSWQHVKTSCEEVDSMREKVDARVRETVALMFSGDQQDASLEWLLQRLSSQFVNKDDLQVLLRELELGILKNVSHHVSVTKQVPPSETVVSAASGAGISGITEAQAQVLVNKALKLYSQDRTGMVDFALESGGGSVLSTRCSETFETKTALISLFGVPLWYFSQSPRVAIQPDIYPGNCWAFRGSQGYLVVRLSMKIHPTAFSLEHIPKVLSPTGNISSAPKDFAVYGLENEHQEEGQLLGRFTYEQEGESLQTLHVLKRPERAFQIVELRILSNWGHPEYTCLYRFRVHGEPIK